MIPQTEEVLPQNFRHQLRGWEPAGVVSVVSFELILHGGSAKLTGARTAAVEVFTAPVTDNSVCGEPLMCRDRKSVV